MSISVELQKLSPGNMVTLYALDTRPVGGLDLLYFSSDTSPVNAPIVWGGVTHAPFSIEASGFEKSSSGALPRPKLMIANLDGVVSALARSLSGLEGARVTRTRTFLKYIDAVNFPDGINPHADPGQYIEREVWYVSRKSGENPLFLEYELAASFDLSGVKLPRRQVVQNVCASQYRSPECSYAGPPVATISDQPTANPLLDRCGKRLNSCKLRFGASNVLPFGGFPGAGLMR